MIDERDELIERVVRALKPLPPLDARAAGRIAAVVRARRARSPGPWARLVERMRVPTFSVGSAGLLAAAGLAIGFVARGAILPSDDAAASGSSHAVRAPLLSAAATPAAPAAVREVPVPITFDVSGATHVSIVGDFNDWDSAATPLTRFGATGPWTATVNVTPGRHLYAFMVDGRLVVDPRAPATRDLDYGGEASVLMVNRP